MLFALCRGCWSDFRVGNCTAGCVGFFCFDAFATGCGGANGFCGCDPLRPGNACLFMFVIFQNNLKDKQFAPHRIAQMKRDSNGPTSVHKRDVRESPMRSIPQRNEREYLSEFFDEHEQLGNADASQSEDILNSKYSKLENETMSQFRSDDTNARKKVPVTPKEKLNQSYGLPRSDAPSPSLPSGIPMYPPYYIPFPVFDPNMFYQHMRPPSTESTEKNDATQSVANSSVNEEIKYLKRNVAIQNDSIKDLNNHVENLHNTIRELVSEIRVLRKELNEDRRNSFYSSELLNSTDRKKVNKEAKPEKPKPDVNQITPDRNEKRRNTPVTPSHKVPLDDDDMTELQYRPPAPLSTSKAKLDFEDEEDDALDRSNKKKKLLKRKDLDAEYDEQNLLGSQDKLRNSERESDYVSWKDEARQSPRNAPLPAKTFDSRNVNTEKKIPQYDTRDYYIREDPNEVVERFRRNADERRYEPEQVERTKIREVETYKSMTSPQKRIEQKTEVHSVYLESDSSVGEAESFSTREYMRRHNIGGIASPEEEYGTARRNLNLENSDSTIYSAPSRRKNDTELFTKDKVRTFSKLPNS